MKTTDPQPSPRFSRGEVIVALLWLSAAALISLTLEVAYLYAILPLPGGIHLIFPITIVLAALFNGVLTRTSRLWSRNMIVVATPLMVWVLGYALLTIFPTFTGSQLLGSTLRSVLLLLAGIAGGVWPILRPSSPTLN
ncbi:hypothetical protein GP475_04510 [Corynebacterium poyangense]|uniref:Uncharacterized protein n=1 Tax=Corynebacterium poyangense TaxID=2684405 RepID=A0A7H0SN60_9CORY|nr:hypothetical protein [Corynebacterium poyangense]MBZ8177004.1 hypothetical protein [Corynebacterium poyangense]QNQ89985.1 hypothetical protein GP475_04510 [Corynebacterium poyangense]